MEINEEKEKGKEVEKIKSKLYMMCCIEMKCLLKMNKKSCSTSNTLKLSLISHIWKAYLFFNDEQATGTFTRDRKGQENRKAVKGRMAFLLPGSVIKKKQGALVVPSLL